MNIVKHLGNPNTSQRDKWVQITQLISILASRGSEPPSLQYWRPLPWVQCHQCGQGPRDPIWQPIHFDVVAHPTHVLSKKSYGPGAFRYSVLSGYYNESQWCDVGLHPCCSDPPSAQFLRLLSWVERHQGDRTRRANSDSDLNTSKQTRLVSSCFVLCTEKENRANTFPVCLRVPRRRTKAAESHQNSAPTQLSFSF